jgi:UDP-xylose:glucoside alpha-1,3-xylosyltransferase
VGLRGGFLSSSFFFFFLLLLLLRQSAVLFSRRCRLIVTIFADEASTKELSPLLVYQAPCLLPCKKLASGLIPSKRQGAASIARWTTLFKPCAAQRLFLPDILGDTARVLYVDKDTVFLRDPADLWDVFTQFDAHQLAAMVSRCARGFSF